MSLYAMTDLEIVAARLWPPDYRLMLDQMRRDEGVIHLSVARSGLSRVKWPAWWAPRNSGPVFALEQAVLEGVQWS